MEQFPGFFAQGITEDHGRGDNGVDTEIRHGAVSSLAFDDHADLSVFRLCDGDRIAV